MNLCLLFRSFNKVNGYKLAAQREAELCWKVVKIRFYRRLYLTGTVFKRLLLSFNVLGTVYVWKKPIIVIVNIFKVGLSHFTTQ